MVLVRQNLYFRTMILINGSPNCYVYIGSQRLVVGYQQNRKKLNFESHKLLAGFGDPK